VNGRGSYQLALQASGSSQYLFAEFFSSPSFVRFIGMNARPSADYLREAPPTRMPATGSSGLAPILMLAALLTFVGAALRVASGRRSLDFRVR
jgi:hypothetical protein